MNHGSFNYVRTYRQRHVLTEGELADLINYRSGAAISRIEVGRRAPSLDAALALQVLFRQEPREMFPGRYEAIEDAVMRRAQILLEQLEGLHDSRSVAKRKFLENLPREPDDLDDL